MRSLPAGGAFCNGGSERDSKDRSVWCSAVPAARLHASNRKRCCDAAVTTTASRHAPVLAPKYRALLHKNATKHPTTHLWCRQTVRTSCWPPNVPAGARTPFGAAGSWTLPRARRTPPACAGGAPRGSSRRRCEAQGTTKLHVKMLKCASTFFSSKRSKDDRRVLER